MTKNLWNMNMCVCVCVCVMYYSFYWATSGLSVAFLHTLLLPFACHLLTVLRRKRRLCLTYKVTSAEALRVTSVQTRRRRREQHYSGRGKWTERREEKDGMDHSTVDFLFVKGRDTGNKGCPLSTTKQIHNLLVPVAKPCSVCSPLSCGLRGFTLCSTTQPWEATVLQTAHLSHIGGNDFLIHATSTGLIRISFTEWNTL